MLKVRKREEEREREEEGGRGRKREEEGGRGREGGRDEDMIKELLALEKLEHITIMVTLF